MPDGPPTCFHYLLADGDTSGLTDAREIGGGVGDGLLVE